MESLPPFPTDPSSRGGILLAGPTASGKTAIAVELARLLHGEIVSADSIQVYNQLRILSARPTQDELKGIPCHLSGHVDAREQYHLARFIEEADHAVADIQSRGKLPILCGGTGLYLRGFLRGIFSGPGASAELRLELDAQASTPEGLSALRAELALSDPESHQRIQPADKIRLVRAIEVLRLTGMPISQLQRQTQLRHPDRPFRYFVLTRPTPELDHRIQLRSRAMIQEGLFDEVREWVQLGYSENHPAFRALGAVHVLHCIQGQISESEMLNHLVRQTRQYAKRQRTWFRAESDATEVPVAITESAASVAKRIVDSLDCTMKASPSFGSGSKL